MRFILQMLATACFIGAVPSAVAVAQQSAAVMSEKPLLVPSDVARVVGLSGLQFSPDGRTIAMVESRANLVENEYRTEIVLVDVATGARRQFTTDRRKAAQPRWSPDGKALAFLAPDADKKLQVFVAPLAGGEAIQASHAKSPVAQFAWSPGSSSIAFAATDPAPEAKGADKFHTGFYLGHDDLTVREKPRSTHMWLVGADGSAERRLTSGEWSLPTVLPPGPPASPLKWMPDGKSIIFVKQASPSSGDRGKAQLHKLDIASGAMSALTPETKRVGYPVPSPDGRNIVFWAPHDFAAGGNQDVWLAQGPDTPSKNLSAAVDRTIFGTWWQPDGKSLVVSGNDGLSVGLWSLGLDGKAQKLDTGPVMPANGYWVDGSISSKGAIAFIGQGVDSPGELYVMDSQRAAPRKMTSVNNWVADAKLGRMEAVHWKGPQGTMIDGVLTLPPNAAPGRKYPVALVIHGGPNSASRLRFGVPTQALAARGFIVFEPNYRGSDNLGNAFKTAIVGDAGEGSGEDILAGLKQVLARPDVEPGKPMISGWSYGGFMTTWLLGRHPDMWKAAVSGAPVTNWQHAFDLSDGNVAQAERLGASPYKDGGAEILWKQSPASMQTKIKAPTLVMSNTEDFRVPFTQAFSLFRSLEDNGVETKFFVFPIRGHSPADPIRQGDMWQVWIDWLDAHKG